MILRLVQEGSEGSNPDTSGDRCDGGKKRRSLEEGPLTFLVSKGVQMPGSPGVARLDSELLAVKWWSDLSTHVNNLCWTQPPSSVVAASLNSLVDR